jgi:dTDP-4-amino-4,6-dideoxygalactose transaminase
MIEVSDLRRQSEALHPQLAAAIQSVLESGWFILGERVQRFEAAFAKYLGIPHAVGVANGTDALELGLRAIGVRAGDRVLTAANAGGYASVAIHACGAQPQFVDVARDGWHLDRKCLDAALASRPRALVVTHLYGQLGPVEEQVAAAHAAGVPVLEDCAQAHGARRAGVHAGGFGDAGCFSFYPTKNLGALGDGGAVVTKDAAIAGRVRSLRQYGWEEKYRVVHAHGRNSRLDEIQAAVLEVKLGYLDRDNARRRVIASMLADGIRNEAIAVPRRGGEDDVVHLFVVRCAARDALRAHLAAEGIRSDVHYPIPDHRQPVFAERDPGLALAATEALAAQVLTLPAHPALADAEVERVIGACNRFRGPATLRTC